MIAHKYRAHHTRDDAAGEIKAVAQEILKWADTAQGRPEFAGEQVNRIRAKAEKILWHLAQEGCVA